MKRRNVWNVLDSPQLNVALPADLPVDFLVDLHVDWSADLLVDLNVDLGVELAVSPIEDLCCHLKVCSCLFLKHQLVSVSQTSVTTLLKGVCF